MFYLDANVCLWFSLSGIIFLSSIALLLSQNSIYFKVNKDNINDKKDLIRGVLGAIIMYTICLFLSLYIICKGKSKTIIITGEPRFND